MFDNKNDPTYIFRNKKTKEIISFMPLVEFLRFLYIKALESVLYSASGNTCQINKMAGNVVKKNEFLTKIFPQFTGIDISYIQETLKKLSIDFRDGWQDKVNPISIIKLFNDGGEYNRELALSCSGVKDSDMFGVVYDDFISKYFDKATKNGTYHKELLYYTNFNITKTGKLATGISNFNTETFRSELLNQYCFLDVDRCIYNFSGCQDRDKIQDLFKLITENIFSCDKQKYDLYEIDGKKLSQIINQINQQISDFLKLANPNNKLCVEYDTETRRFLMTDEKGKLRDATAWLYTALCDYLKQKDLAKSKVKLKDFVENENNLGIMTKVEETHYKEKFKLVKNIAKYFESDLLSGNLKTIEFTEKDRIEKYFLKQTPLEFFFKNPDEIKTKLNEDKNDDVEEHPDKEDSITKYILNKDIDTILTDKGKELLDIVKKIASDEEYFKDRIKKDEIEKTFEQYQSQNGVNCTYRNNTQHKKTKMEFSVLKALIESVDSASSKVYQIFFERLSDYLNYFFCNDKNLSKKELKDGINKEIDKIKKETDDIKQKQDAREREIGKMADENLTNNDYEQRRKEIENKYGTRSELSQQSQAARNRDRDFKKKIFCWTSIKSESKKSDEHDQPIGLNKFEKYFLGYDEEIFNDDIVRTKIEKFVKDNELFKDKAIETTDDEERINIKTQHLVDAIKDYLAGVKQKITFEWFDLYVNYVCQHSKMEFNKIMDTVIDQNELEKDVDNQLNFLITDIIIEYKKALHEIESDKTNKKLENSCCDFGVMNLFHLLQSFINAGYIFTYDLESIDDMCQFLRNAYKIQYLMNHNPQKLIDEFQNKKISSVDNLIKTLLENTSLENDQVTIKMCKMSVYTFSKVIAAVDHMSQINMAQFFLTRILTKNLAKDIVRRTLGNGVIWEKQSGAVGCFMAPMQKVLEVCKTNAPERFKKDINEMLPKLKNGLEWADINKECGLFFDEEKYEMLSQVEVFSTIVFPDDKLAEGYKEPTIRFACFNALASRYPDKLNEFLLSASDNQENLIDVYINNCIGLKEKKWNISDINYWFSFLDKTISLQKDDKGINLNAIKKFVSLVHSMTSKLKDIITANNTNETLKNKAKDIIFKYPINIITSLIKNNSIQPETQKTLDEDTLSDAFRVFYYVYKEKGKDSAFENAIMLFPDATLMQKLKVVQYRFYCLRALIQKHPEDWKEFLQSNSNNNDNLFGQAIKTCENVKLYNPVQVNNFLSFINTIIELNENDKKIGLNALEKFMKLTFKLTEKMVQDSNKDRWKDIILEHPINTITNIIGNIHLAWNNSIEDQDQKNMLKSIFESAMNVLNGVSKYVNEDDMLKNKDLILWLYLIYKKIYFDSNFLNTQQTSGKQLNSNDIPHFLKEYKFSDGDEKISEKNIFYADDRTKEFIDKIRELQCSNLVPLMDIFPKILEEKQKAQQKLAKLFYRHTIQRVSQSIKKIPNKLVSLALRLGAEKFWRVFSAVKVLYKMNRYEDLQDLLLSKDYDYDIVRKLSFDFKIDYRNYSLIIDEFSSDDNILNSRVEGIGIVLKLLLEKKMSISVTQCSTLLYEIKNVYKLAKGEFISKVPNKKEVMDFFEGVWKEYFGTDKNIFDVFVDIIGHLTFDNARFCKENPTSRPDPQLNLRSIAGNLDEMIMTECESKNEEEKKKFYLEHKYLILWLYMSYAKIYSGGTVLLQTGKNKACDYSIDDTIKQVGEKQLQINYGYIHKFLKWLSEYGYQSIQDMIDNGAVPNDILQSIYEKICNKVNDGDAYLRLKKDKIKELIVSDKQDEVMKKLNLSFREYAFSQTKINKYKKLSQILLELDKISFKSLLSAISIICMRRDVMSMGDEYKQPMEMISNVLTKIYFPTNDIKEYVSDEEYNILLKTIAREFACYNQDKDNEHNTTNSEVPEYIYFLIGYLYLLHRTINDKFNYFAVKQDNEAKFSDQKIQLLNRDVNKYLQSHLKLSDKIISENKLDQYDYHEILKPLVIAENMKTKKSVNKLKEMFVKNYSYHLDKSLRHLKSKIKLKDVLEKQQKKIDENNKMETLKKWDEKNKRIKLYEILKSRVDKKRAADKKREYTNLKKWNENAKKIKLKNEIQQKWQERKDKIEAKEKIKNTLKKKYWFTLKKNLKRITALDLLKKVIIKNNRHNVIKNWKKNNNKIKAQEKLKEMIERKQAKINQEKEIKALKKWQKVRRLAIGKNKLEKLIKSHTLKKWKERKDKIEAKEKIKNTLKKKYCFNLTNGLKQLKNEIEASENTKNKQKRSNAWSKIKKTIFAAIIDLISIVIAIIFLKEIILIAVLIVLVIILIVCCGVAIKNGRDYKNLGTKISAFEKRQRSLNIIFRQQTILSHQVPKFIQGSSIDKNIHFN